MEFIAGCTSGIVQSLIGHPIDTIKILQQNRQPFHRNIIHYYRGISYPTAFNLLATGMTFDINARIYRMTKSYYSSGFLTGGLLSPIIFMCDIGKRHYQIRPTERISLKHFSRLNGFSATVARESISNALYMGLNFNMEERYGPLFSGGCAGLASWTMTYPIDVIKTRQMAHPEKNYTFYEAFKKGSLWRGYTACAIRAIVVNVAGFWSYNKIKGLMSQ